MAVIGCLSQKGGAGKSTLARLLATEYTRAGLSTLLADLDSGQQTATRWAGLRNQAGIEPEVEVMPARKNSRRQGHKMVIFDGRPHASAETLEIGRQCDLILLPSGPGYDDLYPQAQLAMELTKAGIDRKKLRFVMMRAGTPAESREAREWIEGQGVGVLTNQVAEKASYRTASSTGRAISETPYPALNDQANALVEEIDLLLRG